MRHPDFTCSRCGSPNLKRSRQISLGDVIKMALGHYPFRCLDCKERTWINLRLFSRAKQVRCPRCLSVDVLPVSPQRLRAGLWNQLRLMLGGHAYRCSFCTHKFVSFKNTEEHHGDTHQRQGEIAQAAAGGQ